MAFLERFTAPKSAMTTILCKSCRRGGGRVGDSRVATSTAGARVVLHILAFLLLMLQAGDCTGTFIPLTRRTTTAAAAFCYPALTISQQQQHEISTRRRKHEYSQVFPTALCAKKVKSTQKKKASGAATAGRGGFVVVGGGGASRQASAAASASSTSASTPASSSSTSSSFGTGAKALRNAANNYDAIRKRDGLKACRDVYVRSPLNNPNLYWFVGKIARQLSPPATPSVSSSSSSSSTTSASSEEQATTTKANNEHEEDDELECCTDFFLQAALFQKRLILDYSKMHLRPQNFGGKYAPGLELWLAPADSEMNVATNKASLCRVVRTPKEETKVVDAAAETAPPLVCCSILTVGYNPEIYLGDEIANGGLRVERDESGNPTKAAFDVNESL